MHSEVRAKVDRERMGKGCNQACLGLSPQLPQKSSEHFVPADNLGRGQASPAEPYSLHFT